MLSTGIKYRWRISVNGREIDKYLIGDDENRLANGEKLLEIIKCAWDAAKTYKTWPMFQGRKRRFFFHDHSFALIDLDPQTDINHIVDRRNYRHLWHNGR